MNVGDYHSVEQRLRIKVPRGPHPSFQSIFTKLWERRFVASISACLDPKRWRASGFSLFLSPSLCLSVSVSVYLLLTLSLSLSISVSVFLSLYLSLSLSLLTFSVSSIFSFYTVLARTF